MGYSQVVTAVRSKWHSIRKDHMACEFWLNGTWMPRDCKATLPEADREDPRVQRHGALRLTTRKRLTTATGLLSIAEV
jgi:hypothetical protein